MVLATLMGIASGMGWMRVLAALGALSVIALFLWDIRIVVPLLLFTFPFGPRYAMPFGNLYLSTVVVGATLGIWLFRNPFLSRPFSIPRTPVFIALAALLTAMGLSAVRGVYHLLANPSELMRFIQFFLYSWLFVIVIQMKMTRNMIKAFLVLAVAVGVAEGALGVVQWFRAPGFYLYGTFDNTHNNFAVYIVFMAILLLGVALESRRFRVLAVALAALVPLVFSAVFSFSRGGYISIAVALPVFFVLPIPRSRKLILLAGSAVLGLLAYYAVPVDLRLRAESILGNVMGTDVGISAASRFEMWKVSFQDFLRNPVFGRGTWSYGLRDNFYMKVLGEAGILGFGAFIVLIYTILKEEARALRTSVRDDFVRGMSMGLLPATVACLVIYNLTGDYVLVHRFMGVFWIVLALILKYSWQAGVQHGE